MNKQKPDKYKIKESEKAVEEKRIRCKWWNIGYCKIGKECSYSHKSGDCKEHLEQGGCSSSHCSERHRRKCKYWKSGTGCFRGTLCQYIHQPESMEPKGLKVSSNEELHKIRLKLESVEKAKDQILKDMEAMYQDIAVKEKNIANLQTIIQMSDISEKQISFFMMQQGTITT